MSAVLFSRIGGDIASLIRTWGEEVQFRPITGMPKTVRASVQAPTPDMLIHDAQQDAFVVYIAAADMDQDPTQFDRLLIRGRERTIHAAHRTEIDGRNLAWTIQVLG